MNRHNTTRQSATMTQRGFTMIELMVTLVILAIAGTFVYTVFMTQHDSYITQRDVSESQQDVRVGLDMLTRDLQSTGYGVGGGGNGIASATATSIQFNVGQGYQDSSAVSPYLSADPAGAVVTVNTVTPFAVNDSIRILSMFDRSQIGIYTINSINSGAKQLTLNPAPSSAHQGDIVVANVATGTNGANSIAYQLITDSSVAGSFILQRTMDGNAEKLADHIDTQGLQFSYILADGTQISYPASPVAADWPNIRVVQVTIRSQTNRDVAKNGGTPRTRSLTAYVRLKNGLI